jgi:hypothetical protein
MSNQSELYEITTRMDKADYRKFSYITIFRKRAQTILLILLVAVGGAGITAMMEGTFSAPRFLVIWAILIVTAVAAIFLMVEYKAMKWLSKVQTGMIGGKQTITFYENYLIAEQENVRGSNKIKYEKLFEILETKDFFIVYANASSASVIRKMDVSRNDIDDFKAFIKAKMGSRYTKLSQAS